MPLLADADVIIELRVRDSMFGIVSQDVQLCRPPPLCITHNPCYSTVTWRLDILELLYRLSLKISYYFPSVSMFFKSKTKPYVMNMNDSNISTMYNNDICQPYYKPVMVPDFYQSWKCDVSSYSTLVMWAQTGKLDRRNSSLTFVKFSNEPK